MDRRRELKLAYKQNPPPMGVFQLKNSISGKIFIGSSMDLPGKNNSLLFQLKTKSHYIKALQEDWNLHGPDAFTFEILETLKTDELPKAAWRDALQALEKKWLNDLKPYDERGYNKEKK